MNRLIKPIFVVLLILQTPLARAESYSTLTGMEASRRLRNSIEAHPSTEARFIAGERIELPISRGFAQLGTSLCWVYAFLNALETNDRVLHPHSTLELSRAAFQFLTMEDRFLRKIDQNEVYLSERGDEIDALKLAVKHGLYAFQSYPDIIDGTEGRYASVDAMVSREPDRNRKIEVLHAETRKIFAALPEVTQLNGANISPLRLEQEIVRGHEWISYAVGRREGWAHHPDPDARRETQAYYMSLEKISKKIHDALKAGFAVTFANPGHVVLLYGAEYDASGKPVYYFIKDSYDRGNGFTYVANAANLHAELMAISTVVF